jgi:hypothetical protein
LSTDDAGENEYENADATTHLLCKIARIRATGRLR